MLRIVFQNLPRSNGFKNLIKRDVLFNHFLLGMLSDADVLYMSLTTYPLQHSLQINNINFIPHLSIPFTWAAMRTISTKSAAFKLAPPTRAPSISGWVINSAVLAGLTLPPYWTRTA